MGEDPSTGRATVTSTGRAGTEGQDPAQLQRQIEQTREQLGDTVEALAHKADVKAQAQEKFEETKATVSEKAESLLGKAKEAAPDDVVSAASQASHKARQNPVALALAVAFAGGFLVGRAGRR